MTFSPSKQDMTTFTRPEGWGNTARILSHPHRLPRLMARKRAAEERLVIQKSAAVSKVKGAIAEAEALNCGCRMIEAGWVIAELNLILKEILPIQPAELPDPDSVSALAARLHRALVILMYCKSTMLLRRTCRHLTNDAST